MRVIDYIALVGLLGFLAAGCTAWRSGGRGVEAVLEGAPAPTKGIGMMHNFPPLEGAAAQGPPGFFVRSRGSIGRAGEPIPMPPAYDTVLYEGELVIVIGKRAQAVSPEEARECILGYTCGMDGSPLVLDDKGARDPARSIAGKSADGIAPVGPRLVRELRPEGHAIVLRINGKEVERANTRDLRAFPKPPPGFGRLQGRHSVSVSELRHCSLLALALLLRL